MDKSLARVLDGVKELAHLPQMGRLFVALLGDRRVPLWLKIAAGAGVIYVVSPIDAIPDQITGIGYLDDVIMLILMLETFIDHAPQAVVLEHCSRLGIDPRDTHLDIVGIVTGSINAVMPLMQNLKGGGGSSEPRPSNQGNYTASQGSAGETGAETGEAESEPRYKRYSAFSSSSQG
jgi:uncharacterized membrane protein YkvA (DUF1232 family)